MIRVGAALALAYVLGVPVGVHAAPDGGVAGPDAGIGEVVRALEDAVAGGRWLEASRLAPRAVVEAPSSGRVRHAAAWAALAAADLPRAEAEARRALVTLPTWPPAHELLARVLLAEGREADAGAVLAEVARAAPGRAETAALEAVRARRERVRAGRRTVPADGAPAALDRFLAAAEHDLPAALEAHLDGALLRRLAAAAGAGPDVGRIGGEVAAGLAAAAAAVGVRVHGFEVDGAPDAGGRAHARLLLERLPAPGGAAEVRARFAAAHALAGAPAGATAEELDALAPGLARGGHAWELELACAVDGARVTAIAVGPEGGPMVDVETALAPMVARPAAPAKVAPGPAAPGGVPRPRVLALGFLAVVLFLVVAVAIARRR